MSCRVSIVFLSLFLLFAPQLHAKNKKKQLLPDYVLQAQYVLVVIPPDAGEALTNPRENRAAQDDVERAIVKWGRFRLATNAQDADLIIAVRKGNKSGPIISHSPVDNRPVIFQPGIADASVGPRTHASSGPDPARAWRIWQQGPATGQSDRFVGRYF